jgi:hypothetical protein
MVVKAWPVVAVLDGFNPHDAVLGWRFDAHVIAHLARGAVCISFDLVNRFSVDRAIAAQA